MGESNANGIMHCRNDRQLRGINPRLQCDRRPQSPGHNPFPVSRTTYLIQFEDEGKCPVQLSPRRDVITNKTSCLDFNRLCITPIHRHACAMHTLGLKGNRNLLIFHGGKNKLGFHMNGNAYECGKRNTSE